MNLLRKNLYDELMEHKRKNMLNYTAHHWRKYGKYTTN